MKKLNWLFMAICLAVMPALQSCDDNDGYSLGDFTPPLWATVRVTGNAFYLNCDVWGTLWPVNTDIGWYDAVDGQRVITVFITQVSSCDKTALFLDCSFLAQSINYRQAQMLK